MTTNYHTQISTGAAGNAITFNSALGQLDLALTNFADGTNPFDFTQFSTAPTITLDVSGNCSLTGASQIFIVAANSGTSDTMVNITNRPTGGDGFYIFKADTGDTITIQDGTINTSSGSDYVLTGDDVAIIFEIGGTLYLFTSQDPLSATYTPGEDDDWVGTQPTTVQTALDRSVYQKGQGYISGYLVNVTVTNSVTVTAGECVDDAYTGMIVKNTQTTISTATTGANALDTGTIANSTWYFVFMIFNPTTSTAAGLMSASQTPSLPSGYTIFRRVGMVKTDGSANLYFQETLPGYGAARKVIYNENTAASPFQIYDGTGNLSTSPTWDTADLSAIVPITSREAIIIAGSVSGGGAAEVFHRHNSNGQHLLYRVSTASDMVNKQISLTATQTVDFTSNAAVDEDFYLDVQGYIDNLMDDISFKT